MKKDYTSDNVKKLLALSKSKLKIKDTDKVTQLQILPRVSFFPSNHTHYIMLQLINRALKGKLKAKAKTRQKDKQPKEETTVFTEEDFEKFESEYFGE